MMTGGRWMDEVEWMVCSNWVEEGGWMNVCSGWQMVSERWFALHYL